MTPRIATITKPTRIVIAMVSMTFPVMIQPPNITPKPTNERASTMAKAKPKVNRMNCSKALRLRTGTVNFLRRIEVMVLFPFCVTYRNAFRTYGSTRMHHRNSSPCRAELPHSPSGIEERIVWESLRRANAFSMASFGLIPSLTLRRFPIAALMITRA